ncbi:hypothetical protein [Butyrivibrio sp. AD3002]|uniref:hypothetical protein n=1 Tax=Butyrivibrio sp. AD3002 TaxID=1280670 RepID=UPI0003B5EB56|nr:hypothetical protein [Butyrivibrio sp. AD3002]
MNITKEFLRDIFYRMYFYIPEISEKMPSYKTEYAKFWKKYGIEVLNAKVKYSDSDKEQFFSEYSASANSVDVSIEFRENKKTDANESGINNDFNDTIRNLYKKNPELPYGVNEYWKAHAEELLFVISTRNDIKNQAIKTEVQKSLSEFNDNALRFINELIQNADDCQYKDDVNKLTMIFDQVKSEIVVSYPENGFTYDDIISLSSINETNKMTDFDKATNTIGEKGRGFKSIFVYFKEVEIESGGYHFKYNVDEANMFQPIYMGKAKKESGTTLKLRLKDEIVLTSDGNQERHISAGMNELIKDVKDFYGAKDPVKLYRNNSIFFTRNFTELVMIFSNKSTSEIIRIVNTHEIKDAANSSKVWWDNPDNSELHYCVGSMEYHSGQGIKNNEVSVRTINALPQDYKLSLVGMVKYLDFGKDIIVSRYGDVTDAQATTIGKTMPIIIYGIKDVETNDNISALDVSAFSGHMYTYLPTSLNISLPFIFQMPFDLEDNRSCPKSGSAWNMFLLDKVWNPDNSVIKDWYEYVAENELVDSIYNYLPTSKNSIGNNYKTLAFYLDDDFNFDPHGGSKYAAVAKDQITTFNNNNSDKARALFECLKIFENIDTSELVSVGTLQILDKILSLFDCETGNVYWKHFKVEHPTLHRFIYDEEDPRSHQVVAFQKYIGKSGIVLKWDQVMKSSSIQKKISNEMKACGAEKKFDYMQEFTQRFLSETVWISAYGLKNIAELTKEQTNVIRACGSKILYFRLQFFGNRNKWVPFDCSEKASPVIWVTSSNLINSYEMKRDDENISRTIRVGVIKNSDEKYNDSVIDQLIGKEISNVDEILALIENWSDERVTLEDKITIAGTYYLNYLRGNDGINTHLSNLFNKVQDINSSKVVNCPQEAESEENSVEWERLRFFAWHGAGKKNEFKLNLIYISESIAEIINPAEENIITCNDKHVSVLTAITGRYLTEDEKSIGLEKFKRTYHNCVVNPDYFKFLPNRTFIKLPSTGYLLLKSEEFLSDAIDSETMLSTEFIQNVRDKYAKVQANNYETGKLGRNIGTIKAIQAYQIFSLIDNNNYREIVGKEGDVCNELLQNINDFITPGSNAVICIDEDDDAAWMTLVYEEKKHIEVVKGQEEERHGFLPSDILALISIGNSNKEKDGDKYTGNKGIGFKNVYKVFDQVFVDSNGFNFLLDDSIGVDPEALFEELTNNKVGNIYNDKNCKVEAIMQDLADDQDVVDEKGLRRRFPIVQVTKEEIDKAIYYVDSGRIGNGKKTVDSLTAFRFRFRSDEMIEHFYNQIESSYLQWLFAKNKDLLNAFRMVDIATNDYNMLPLFLHNMHEMVLYENGAKKGYKVLPISKEMSSVDDNWVESEQFFSNRGFMTELNLISAKSNRYEKKKNTDSDGVFAHVEVRFIKRPVLVTKKNEKVTIKDGRLYITLPTDISTGGAVHINVPALEAKANRRDVFSFAFDKTKEGEWNQSIAMKALGLGGVFEKMFNSFTEQYIGEVSNYAFLYVPVTLLSTFSGEFPLFESCLEELKYIPCRTNAGLKMRSLREIRENPNVYMLDMHMRAWFELMDPNYEVFYKLAVPTTEFVELLDPNNWGLLDELKHRRELMPEIKTYSSRDFFEHISKYWNYYYSQLEVKYKKECDKSFSNRINLITAKTGIDNHYSKWQLWKRFYKDSMAGKRKSSYIANMTKAICFDCDEYSLAFYFSADDINDILDNDKLIIPNSIVKHYKKYLVGKGYFDFMPYYELLKREIISVDAPIEESTEIQIGELYSLAAYTGEHKDELAPIDIQAEDILACVYENFGVNSLEDLRQEIPILLMNNTFIEADDREFFIELPKKLFMDNSLELKEGQLYDELLNTWVEKGFVVSRANIAEARNIYELDVLDTEFYELLPTISDSRLFLELLNKNNLHSEDMVNNILQFWKARERVGTGSSRSDYFELYVDALDTFLEKNGNITIQEPELEYDIECLVSKKIISKCNELSSRHGALEILLENQYDTNPVMYWNEIEMSLTAEQRRTVAELYTDDAESDEEINEGIECFLDHLYMCDDNVSLVSHYPSSQYLKVVVDNEKAFVLFKDYTESIILLLKEVFGFSLGSKQFKPFVNLYEYNSLLPLGSQEEYTYVRGNVFNLLDEEDDDDAKSRLKMQLMSLQFQLPDNKMICGYGMDCPFIKTNDVIEQSSLQVFEYSVFGFHIAITLYGSKEAKDVLQKYSAKTLVKIIGKKGKKKKDKKVEEFEVCNGKYSFDGRELVLRGADIEKEKLLVASMLDYLIKKLDDICNNLIFEIEMLSDKGARKKEVLKLNLTHCHRAIMVYELLEAKKQFES